LRESEVAISDANRALRGLEAQSRALGAQLAAIGAERAARSRALESERAALGRLLAARALAGAAGGAPDFVRLALSGEDLADAARRLHYLTYVSRAVAQAIAAHRAGLAELARLQREAEDKGRELAAVESRAQDDRARLLAERREHRRLVERLGAEIRGARTRMQAMVADEARLAHVVEAIARVLAARPSAGFRGRGGALGQPDASFLGAFSELRGRLRLPVPGEVSSPFGAPRGESGAPSKGIFIRAPEGEPVRAVGPGRVVFADWMRGFGNLLIVDHGEDYLSVYANNESLLKQTGDTVTLGEPLATVGATGGSEQTGLYFELRHMGRPLDPISWMKPR